MVHRLKLELDGCRALLEAARRRAVQAEEEVEALIQRCERLHESARAEQQVPFPHLNKQRGTLTAR